MNKQDIDFILYMVRWRSSGKIECVKIHATLVNYNSNS